MSKSKKRVITRNLTRRAARLCIAYGIPVSYLPDVRQEILASPYEARKKAVKGLTAYSILAERLNELSKLFNPNEISIDGADFVQVRDKLPYVNIDSERDTVKNTVIKVRSMILLYLNGKSLASACKEAGIDISNRNQFKRLEYHVRKYVKSIS